MKTILIIIGIALVVLLAFMGYACIIVGSDAERQMEAWERERNAGRDIVWRSNNHPKILASDELDIIKGYFLDDQVVVAECTIDEIMVVHSSSGVTYAKKLKGNNPEATKAIQAQIRKNAEAFLSKRLIICEGKTEMGFIRAVDSYIASTKDYRMAHKGVGTADGNGSDIFKCADILRDCGYDICILMDSDKDSEDAEKERMRSDGIPVFDWDRPNAFEEQCFTEITLDAIHAEIRIAIDEKSADSVAVRLTNAGIQFVRDGDSITFPSLSQEQRKMLGKIAKNCSWYKRIGLGEQFGNIVMSCMDSFGDNSAIKRNVNGLAEWVINDNETGT